MEFFVYSRMAIEATPAHDVPHVIISVTTPRRQGGPDKAQLNTNEHTKRVLRLCFHDLDRCVEGIDHADLFSNEQAKSVVETAALPVERVIVHCDAGLSRSPAIAAALMIIHNGPGSDRAVFERYRPNMRVYRKILAAAGLGYEEAGTRYTHDCTGCVFLGQEDRFDLYWCVNPTYRKLDSIVARYGNEGSEYLASHPPEAFVEHANPRTWELAALRAAKREGLYCPDTLHKKGDS